MKNYADLWKKHVNFKEVSYDDFVTKYYGMSNTYLIEKIDGMLGALICQEGKTPVFQFSGGGVMSDAPVLYEQASWLKKLGIKDIILIGELVAQKFRTILPFNQTSSIVKTAYLPQHQDLVHHYVYDVYSIGNKRLNFKEAITFIAKNYGKIGLPHVHVPKIVYGDMKAFRRLFAEVKDKSGIEGVVVRDLKGRNIKVKETGTVDLAIIGAGNVGMPAWPKKHISYLMSSFIDKDGNFRSSSKIGTGFTHKERADFFKYIMSNKLYEEKGDFLVSPKIVVQMKYYRVRITPTPTYKFVKGRYVFIGNRMSVTFSNPTFERLRPDKKPVPYDVRLEQIPDWKK